MASGIDEASLIFIPSGWNNGTIGALIPDDGSSDGNFIRNDNQTPTYGIDLASTKVGEDGNLKFSYENFIYYSNRFDTKVSNKGWEFNGHDTPLIGSAGYDGTNNAWYINKQSASAYLRQFPSPSIVGTLVTGYIYAKAGTLEHIRVYDNSGAGGKYHLSGEGTSGISNSSTLATTIEKIGDNGWYKCGFTINNCGSSFFVKGTSSDYNQGLGDFYLQHFQVNQGGGAYPYLESDSTILNSGIYEDQPRIDYTGNNGGNLLAEGSSQNLWHAGNAVKFPNDVSIFNVGPSLTGYNDASILRESGSTTAHYTQQAAILPTNANPVTYTASVFVKEINRNQCEISFYADSITTKAVFYLDTQTTNNANAKIIPYGNGWYRCVFTASILQSTGGYNFLRFSPSVNNSSYYTGNNWDAMYFFGYQLEAKTFATSYIPTYGSSITRLSETVGSFNANINSEQWTLFFELDLNDYSNIPVYQNVNFINVYGSGVSLAVSVRVFNNSGNYTIAPYFNVNTSYAFGNTDSSNRTDNGKFILRHDGGGSYTAFWYFENTATKKTATGLTDFVVTTLNIGTGSARFRYKKMLAYDIALSDDICNTL